MLFRYSMYVKQSRLGDLRLIMAESGLDGYENIDTHLLSSIIPKHKQAAPGCFLHYTSSGERCGHCVDILLRLPVQTCQCRV